MYSQFIPWHATRCLSSLSSLWVKGQRTIVLFICCATSRADEGHMVVMRAWWSIDICESNEPCRIAWGSFRGNPPFWGRRCLCKLSRYLQRIIFCGEGLQFSETVQCTVKPGKSLSKTEAPVDYCGNHKNYPLINFSHTAVNRRPENLVETSFSIQVFGQWRFWNFFFFQSQVSWVLWKRFAHKPATLAKKSYLPSSMSRSIILTNFVCVFLQISIARSKACPWDWTSGCR